MQVSVSRVLACEMMPIGTKCRLSPAGTQKMECVHPGRGDRRQVVEGIQYPFGMTSLGSNIYYTDWRRSDKKTLLIV